MIGFFVSNEMLATDARVFLRFPRCSIWTIMSEIFFFNLHLVMFRDEKSEISPYFFLRTAATHFSVCSFL